MPADETKDAQAGDGQAEAVAAELKSCDLRPTAEEMFGQFMVAVAGRPLLKLIYENDVRLL